MYYLLIPSVLLIQVPSLFTGIVSLIHKFLKFLVLATIVVVTLLSVFRDRFICFSKDEMLACLDVV